MGWSSSSGVWEQFPSINVYLILPSVSDPELVIITTMAILLTCRLVWDHSWIICKFIMHISGLEFPLQLRNDFMFLSRNVAL